MKLCVAFGCSLLSLISTSVDGGGYRDADKKAIHREQALRNFYPKGLNSVNAATRGASLFQLVQNAEMPSEFNWCGSPNYCSPSWNQHIPKYCGSCFLHAALSTFSDRLAIQQGDSRENVMIGRQSFLSCAPPLGFSDGCGGGELFEVWEYMKQNGLPDESCRPYKATDHKEHGKKICPREDYCMNCMTFGPESKEKCWGIEHPIRYFVEDYGKIPADEFSIRQEIYKNGPVGCGIAAYDAFDFGYRGGIWTQGENETEVDHDVEIVGWGEEGNQKYWIIRNSWGTFWGENGFFKIPRGVNHMQIESDCWFVVPSSKDLNKVDKGELHGSMYGLQK